MRAMGELITQAEAARRAGVTRAAIYNWLKRGLLTVYIRKIDGRRLIDADELARKLVTLPEGEQEEHANHES